MTDLKAAFEKIGLPGASVAFAAACHDLARLALNRQADPRRAVHVFLGLAAGGPFREALQQFLADVAKQRGNGNTTSDDDAAKKRYAQNAGHLDASPSSSDFNGGTRVSISGEVAHLSHGTNDAHGQDCPSPDTQPDGAAAQSRRANSDIAQTMLSPAPSGPSPGFVNALKTQRERTAAVMSGFYVTERQGGRTAIEDVEVHRLDRVLAMLGKRAATNAVEYNVVWLLKSQIARQAFIPDGSRVRDICDAAAIRNAVVMGQAIANSPMIQLPEQLRAAAAEAAA